MLQDIAESWIIMKSPTEFCKFLQYIAAFCRIIKNLTKIFQTLNNSRKLLFLHSLQVLANSFKSFQILAKYCKFLQTLANSYKFLQILEESCRIFFKYYKYGLKVISPKKSIIRSISSF